MFGVLPIKAAFSESCREVNFAQGMLSRPFSPFAVSGVELPGFGLSIVAHDTTIIDEPAQGIRLNAPGPARAFHGARLPQALGPPPPTPFRASEGANLLEHTLQTPRLLSGDHTKHRILFHQSLALLF